MCLLSLQIAWQAKSNQKARKRGRDGEDEEDGETEAAITARKFAKCGNNNAANRSQIVANMEISRCPIEAAAGAAVISIWLQIGGRKGVIKVLALVPDEDSQCRQ